MEELRAQYEAAHPNDDPLNLKFKDDNDRDAYVHDRDSYGGAYSDVQNNSNYAFGRFGEFLETGNLYALGAVPFIGVLTSVYHTAVGIGQAAGAIAGGLASAGVSLFNGFSNSINLIGQGNFSGAMNAFMGGVSGALGSLGQAFYNAWEWIKPVIIDLGLEGLILTSPTDSNVVVQADDGTHRYSGWVGAEDGILAFDQDGDGAVDGYAEYGLARFKPDAVSDLDGLSAFDSNHDGVFDAQDEMFDRFLVWRDANGDGVWQEGESVSLDALGIAAIDLHLNGDASVEAGNYIANTTQVRFTDGTVRDAADVAFASSGISDQSSMITLNATSHQLGGGLELVTLLEGGTPVHLDEHNLGEETSLVVVMSSIDGDEVHVDVDVAATLLGSAGDDAFFGSDAATTFMSGVGVNIMQGGVRGDSYIIEAAAGGRDTVTDAGGADAFSVGSAVGLTASLDGADLLLRSANDDYELRIMDWFSSDYAEDRFTLGDQTLSGEQMLAWANSSTAGLMVENDWALAG